MIWTSLLRPKHYMFEDWQLVCHFLVQKTSSLAPRTEGPKQLAKQRLAALEGTFDGLALFKNDNFFPRTLVSNIGNKSFGVSAFSNFFDGKLAIPNCWKTIAHRANKLLSWTIQNNGLLLPKSGKHWKHDWDIGLLALENLFFIWHHSQKQNKPPGFMSPSSTCHCKKTVRSSITTVAHD